MHEAPLPSVQQEYPGLPRLSEAELHRRRELVFLVLAGLFLGSLTMLNILGITRFISLFAIDFDGNPETKATVFAVAVGVLPYPLTFLATDFISELYGRRRASQVVWIGFMLNAWVVLVLWLGGVMPGFEERAADGTLVRDAAGRLPVFFEVRALAFGAVVASMIAYLTAQFVDVYVFHFWKNLTRGKHLWLRNNGSTLVSQMVDTVAVILITHFFAHALPVDAARAIWPQLMVFIATGYVFKAIVALLDTIPFYLGAAWLTRYLRLPPADHWPHPPAGAAVEAGVG
ncbi:MAG: queuosine precursor transporter [Phycisphaeraceae bacterium]|nr:queuosine precursor transporter [Phycisphaeraceae bacterium]